MEPPQPPPVLKSEDRLWIVLCHLSLLIGVGFLLPLVVYLVKKADNPLVAEHAKEALNFHISFILYLIVGLVLCFVLIGIPIVVALVVFAVVCSIIAAIKGSEGGFYRYPLTLRLVA